MKSCELNPVQKFQIKKYFSYRTRFIAEISLSRNQ
jgi:hypothetical protein